MVSKPWDTVDPYRKDIPLTEPFFYFSRICQKRRPHPPKDNLYIVYNQNITLQMLGCIHPFKTPCHTSAIPLGIPDAFESELFTGKIIVRIRDVPSENPDGDPKEYPGSIGGKNNLAFEPVFVVAFIRVKTTRIRFRFENHARRESSAIMTI